MSADKVYELFIAYRDAGDFVGIDMARKFLQMGFTRARRYANHASGGKYAADGSVKPQDDTWDTSPKAEAARIFYAAYAKAKDDPRYLELKAAHKLRYTHDTT